MTFPSVSVVSAAACSLPKLLDLLEDADEKKASEILSMTDETGKTPFHTATRSNPECLKVMIEKAGMAVAYKCLTSSTKSGATAAFMAASTGNAESLLIILEVAVKQGHLAKMVQQKDSQGKTIVHHIMYNGTDPCLKLVIEKCDKNVLDKLLTEEDSLGRTPLHWGAHSQNSCAAMKCALEYFGKKKAAKLICEPKRTYIHRAAKYNYENLVALLDLLKPAQILEIVARKENAQRNAVHSAMDHKDGQAINELIKHIGKQKAKELILERNSEGVTALTMAAGNNFTDECLKIVSNIVGKDKSIELLYDQDNSQGLNSGHNAAINAKTGPLEFILDLCNEEKSIELLTVKEKGGKTALDHASMKTGHLQIIVNALGEKVVSDLLKIKDDDGSTVIHRGGFSKAESMEMIINLLGSEETFELLKQRDGDGQTALHIIVKERCSESFQTIVDMMEEGQVTNLLSETNSEGNNVLQEAANNEELDMVNLILDRIDLEVVRTLLNHRNHLKQNALHLSAIALNSEGLISLFEMLEYKNALQLLCELDDSGWNAAHYAAKDDNCLGSVLSMVKEQNLSNVISHLRTQHEYNVTQIAAMAHSVHTDELKKYSTRKDGDVKLRHTTNNRAINALHQIVIDYGAQVKPFTTKISELSTGKWSQVTIGDVNNQTPVHYVATHAHPECLGALFFHLGYQKNLPSPSELLLMKDDSKETPIQAARHNPMCEEMWTEMQKYLQSSVEKSEFEREKKRANRRLKQEQRAWLPNIEKQGMYKGANFSTSKKS